MISTARSGLARTSALEARLQSFAPLRPADVEVIHACGEDARTVAAGADALPDGNDAPRLLVSGWAASIRALADGRRQILYLFLPGDVLGLTALRLDGLVALTGIVTTDARPVAAALAGGDSAYAGLRLAWERAQAARHHQLLDQIVRLGRLSAHERMAHLLLELVDRHRRAGLSDGRRMTWPLTQETLADVVGLSVVHVNRVLQQLRREGLIALRAGQLVLPDPERLAQTAAWDD